MMKPFLKSIFTAVLLLAGGTLAVAAGHDSHNAIRVGKGATIQVSEPTQIGDLVLKPGTYSVKYKTVGDQHSMEVAMIADAAASPYSYATSYKRLGEVKCQIEPVARKNQRTLVYADNTGGVRHVTKLEVGGETVAHLF